MNEKAQKLIQVGMKLFTKKGIHNTSIQEIAAEGGMSKGAFYLHFKSKKEFVIAIYDFYYNTMKSNLDSVEKNMDLDAREKLPLEMSIFFEEFLKQKEFIIMHFQENFQIQDELEDLVLKMRTEIFEWLEGRLLEIYGEGLRPFIVDAVTLANGLLDSYLKVMFFTGADIDLKELGQFIVRRLDDIAYGMMKTESSPQITRSNLQPFFKTVFNGNVKAKITSTLASMREQVQGLNLEAVQKQEVYESIDVLLNEVKKDDPQKVIFQGMLANLQAIKELDDNRNEVATLLQMNG